MRESTDPEEPEEDVWVWMLFAIYTQTDLGQLPQGSYLQKGIQKAQGLTAAEPTLCST